MRGAEEDTSAHALQKLRNVQNDTLTIQDAGLLVLFRDLSADAKLSYHSVTSQDQAWLRFECEMSPISSMCLSTGSPEGGAV